MEEIIYTTQDILYFKGKYSSNSNDEKINLKKLKILKDDDPEDFYV